MDAKTEQTYGLVKSGYDRVDSALYALKDGDTREARYQLDKALNELKDAFRRL